MCARTPRIGLRLLLARRGIVEATGPEVTGACRGSRLELGLSFSQLLQKKRREQRDSQHEHDDHSPEHHGAPPYTENAMCVPHYGRLAACYSLLAVGFSLLAACGLLCFTSQSSQNRAARSERE